MGRSSLNLTGDWSGEFGYPRHSGPTTPFLATLRDDGGRLTGTIIEPDILSGAASVTATLEGLRHGSSVDFTKTYSAPPFGYENPVDYVGSLSDDGNTVTGVWSLLDLDGTFEMRREAASEELAEEEEAVSELILVGDPVTSA
jgi:hypothetical protein